MPELSVVALTLLGARYGQRRCIVRYDRIPRHLRGLIRGFRCDRESAIRLLRFLFCSDIREIMHGDSVPGYGDAHLRSQEEAADAVEALLSLIRKDPWVQLMVRFYGEEPALSYAAKHLADKVLFPNFLAANVLACSDSRTGVLHMWNPALPDDWIPTAAAACAGMSGEVFSWPPWIRSGFCFAHAARAAAVLLFWLVRDSLRRLWHIPIAPVKRYKVITELVDPVKLGGGSHDADFFVDGDRVRPQDVLLFVTDEQAGKLSSLGYDVPEVLAGLRNIRGYGVFRTADFPCSGGIARRLLQIMSCAFAGLWAGGNTALCGIFVHAWREWAEFAPMFESCPADVLLYATFPNGRTGIRFNSGLLTSLCREHSVRSVHYQTRATHSKNYEYKFDCSDLHIAWGDKWHRMLGRGMMFHKRIATAGCIYLPGLLEVKNRTSVEPETDGDNRGMLVCVFPSDVNLDGRHHYTREYSVRFMCHCARLAILWPDVRFVVKCKEPAYADEVMADAGFAGLYGEVPGNLSFFKAPRHDYAELLASSDIVLAVGFTTPGTEALLLGKRVIFYNELQCGGQAFEGVPDLTAADFERFSELFQRGVNDVGTGPVWSRDILCWLDPYRDGGVIRRIHEAAL